MTLPQPPLPKEPTPPPVRATPDEPADLQPGHVDYDGQPIKVHRLAHYIEPPGGERFHVS